MKIKDREARRELMEKVQDSKSKVVMVLEVLRNAANGCMNNATIAQLNDCAFKAIRKQGHAKKLDERAIKNESIYKMNDQKLKTIAKNLDEAKVRDENKALIDSLGCCPMSQCDTVELMKEGDCMCLCLQISRSEAVINDPTKLIIQNIVPTFMSLDSFMDSSIFSLKANQDAAGGFDYKNQGNLALGVGREKVSGVLPLFLFKEHKEIVRLKMQPLYGFMCCLDPMGYAASQAFTVPFLVLLKAIENVASEPTEMNKTILSLVMETCKDMVTCNEALKKQIIEQANQFAAGPANRTADIIASI